MEVSVFSALADPTRRALITNLATHSPKTATQLATDYSISRQGLLKHLAILEAARLVVVQPAGREKRYSLSPTPLSELEVWVEQINAQWEARLLRLKALLEPPIEAGE